jgi:uncharacterized membrane protein (UPF0127 family)
MNASKKSNNRPFVVGAGFLALLFVVYLIGNTLQKPRVESVKQATLQIRSSVEFVKQGELRFLTKNNKLLGAVDIEIAEDEARRMQGLMYRETMKEDQAMLFIFPDEAERSFWMKNTIVSLDMIYANTRNEIVGIQKNTTPYSEESYPSNAPAKYVVEVIAGYCENHSIKAGDRIEWKRVSLAR